MSVLDWELNEHKKTDGPTRGPPEYRAYYSMIRLRAACSECCEELGDIEEVQIAFAGEVSGGVTCTE
jgi:hypothetical protein